MTHVKYERKNSIIIEKSLFSSWTPNLNTCAWWFMQRGARFHAQYNITCSTWFMDKVQLRGKCVHPNMKHAVLWIRISSAENAVPGMAHAVRMETHACCHYCSCYGASPVETMEKCKQSYKMGSIPR